jgi:aspartyl-tRNA(Asn)/glutamyl-tRNA(Gln) amidotransferase subunit C
MSQLSAEEIDHLAKLTRIKLSAEERQEFAGELPKIVEFIEQLRQVQLSSTLVEAPAVPLEGLREDSVGSQALSLEQLQRLAPEWQNGQNVVPAVFGNDSEGGDA